jgi:hypothetical protein
LGRHEKPKHYHRDDKLEITCRNHGENHGGMKSVAYFGNWVWSNLHIVTL